MGRFGKRDFEIGNSRQRSKRRQRTLTRVSVIAVRRNIEFYARYCNKQEMTRCQQQKQQIHCLDCLEKKNLVSILSRQQTNNTTPPYLSPTPLPTTRQKQVFSGGGSLVCTCLSLPFYGGTEGETDTALRVVPLSQSPRLEGWVGL